MALDITQSATPTGMGRGAPRGALDYLRVMKRNKWGIISVVVLAGIVGALISSSITPLYRAETKLFVRPQPDVLPADALMAAANNLSSYQAQRELIRSRTVAEKVVETLDLTKSEDFRPQNSKFVAKVMKTVGLRPKKSAQGTALSKADAERMFQSHLNVQALPASEIILLQYDSHDPKLAAKVVNQVANTYIEAVDSSRQDVNEQTVEWLGEKLENVRKKLVEAEAKLQSFQATEKIGDSEHVNSIVREKISSVSSELVKATSRRAEAEIRRQQLMAAEKAGLGYGSIQEVMSNPLVQRFKEQEAELRRRVLELSERYGEKHPKLISARSELSTVQKRLDAEIKQVVAGLMREYDLAVTAEDKFRRLAESTQDEIRRAKGTSYDLALLEQEVTTNRQLYNLLLTRLNETDVSKQDKAVNVRVLDVAKPPAAPYKPNNARIIGTSVILGLFIGIVMAVVRENLDDTFKTGSDLGQKLALPVLGVFPHLHRNQLEGQAPERYVAMRPRSSVSEAVNNIRTNLLFSAADDPMRVILMTSAVSEEGKTTISSNLGIALARLGPTLILEADLRKPRLKAFRRNARKAGVFEFVTGKNGLKECITRDPRVKNLFMITVERVPANPLEFLASRRFANALESLKKYFRYIVIDAPPVLPVSDALILSKLADGTIFVVGAESTVQAAASEALVRLAKADARIVGTILSQARQKTLNAYGGGYYYGGGGGYYYDANHARS